MENLKRKGLRVLLELKILTPLGIPFTQIGHASIYLKVTKKNTNKKMSSSTVIFVKKKPKQMS